MLGALVLGAAACGGTAPLAGLHSQPPGRHAGHTTTTRSATTASSGTTTSSSGTTTSPPTQDPAAKHGPIREPPLPAPGHGFVADKVTAVGDSVMIDYEGALADDLPGVHVTAAVSRWWTTGVTILRRLRSDNELGAVVIVGLATNGPVSPAQFEAMMSVLSGASRVVFVNTRVDRTWQDSNNAVLAKEVPHYRRTFLVNWYGLAIRHPGWLYTTQTHLPIDGPGAQALAAVVAAAA